MYTNNDIAVASRTAKLRLILGILLICAFAAVVIAFTLLEWQIPQLIASGIGFIVCYFVWSFKIVPWLHYNKFIKELSSGRRRSMECEFESISDETRMFDNVEVRDVMVNVGQGEEDQRLYVLDADKALPEIAPGEKIVVTSYGNFITDVAKA